MEKFKKEEILPRGLWFLVLEPSSLVINEIARGYCEKKDFEDLLSFFAEMKCAPTVIVAIQAQKGQICFC